VENRSSVSTRGRRVQRRTRRGQPGTVMARAMPSHCRLSPSRSPKPLPHAAEENSRSSIAMGMLSIAEQTYSSCAVAISSSTR